MNGYQPLALSFAEELSDLKRRYEKLERKHADLEDVYKRQRPTSVHKF